MKLGRVQITTPDGPQARLVMVHPEQDRVVDLAQAERLRLEARGASTAAAARIASARFPASMAAAIASGPEFVEAAHEADARRGVDASSALDRQSWIAAVDPPMLRDCIAYVAHMQAYYAALGHELAPQHFVQPGYYKGTNARCFGHNETIPWPGYTEFLDYELEIGIVVGCRGHDWTPEEAARGMFGITIFNDWSARDYQNEEMKIGMGPTKCKDFANGLGPWITTIDEIEDLQNLRVAASINGERYFEGSTHGMQWSPQELLAYISLGDVVQPGDVFGSGTVAGGSTLESGRRLKPGDVVELWLEGVGTLRSPIAREPEPKRWRPTPRPNPKAQA